MLAVPSSSKTPTPVAETPSWQKHGTGHQCMALLAKAFQCPSSVLPLPSSNKNPILQRRPNLGEAFRCPFYRSCSSDPILAKDKEHTTMQGMAKKTSLQCNLFLVSSQKMLARRKYFCSRICDVLCFEVLVWCCNNCHDALTVFKQLPFMHVQRNKQRLHACMHSQTDRTAMMY